MSTLGAMKAAGTRVRLMGCGCANWSDVDLGEMIAMLGEDGSLWDRRPPCPECGELQHFLASPGPSTPFRPLQSVPRDSDQNPLPFHVGGWTGRMG
jgi:hypothetical protein